MGNRILRQRLKGPILADYYPRRVVTFKDLKKAYPEFEFWNEEEEDRLEAVAKYVTTNRPQINVRHAYTDTVRRLEARGRPRRRGLPRSRRSFKAGRRRRWKFRWTWLRSCLDPLHSGWRFGEVLFDPMYCYCPRKVYISRKSRCRISSGYEDTVHGHSASAF